MSEYLVNIEELNRQRQEIALQDYEKMQTFLFSLNSVSFLKKNYEFKKLSQRKTEPNITTLLSVTWLKICMLSGLKENQTQEIWQDITNLIFNYHSDLTLEEIWKAFELERFCEYPEKTNHFQFFNSEYVASILKKYRIWKQNTKIQHNISPPATQNNLPEITESKKTEILHNGILRVFNEFKETNNISEPCSHLFDELLLKGVIRPANDEKTIKYYESKQKEASEIVLKEIEEETKTATSITRKKLLETLENIKSNNNNARVIAKTKKIVLQEYFKMFIEKNKDIKDILKKINHV